MAKFDEVVNNALNVICGGLGGVLLAGALIIGITHFQDWFGYSPPTPAVQPFYCPPPKDPIYLSAVPTPACECGPGCQCCPACPCNDNPPLPSDCPEPPPVSFQFEISILAALDADERVYFPNFDVHGSFTHDKIYPDDLRDVADYLNELADQIESCYE